MHPCVRLRGRARLLPETRPPRLLLRTATLLRHRRMGLRPHRLVAAVQTGLPARLLRYPMLLRITRRIAAAHLRRPRHAIRRMRHFGRLLRALIADHLRRHPRAGLRLTPVRYLTDLSG